MKKTSDKGFTLVELIVVLIILAALAALVAPALIGYIDEARAKKYLPNARACLEAAQAMFSQQYGLNENLRAGDPVVSGAMDESSNENRDQDITNTQFAKDVLALAGVPDGTPYLFMVGLGSARDAVGTTRQGHTVTEQDKYTVYYAVYMETASSKAWYYYNGEWTTTNPRYNNTSLAFDSNNIIITGIHKGVRVQYYLISNHNPAHQGRGKTISAKAFWDWLKAMK
ncbi:MAG: prepilin-type N-terminal cleavage/methylation domain-containing protein [Lachnospiraceae bacterium]|nr:prepilin-type N-terminal cleavage/methylation domain-containing protein [Lachnospiraceae bacterium]